MKNISATLESHLQGEVTSIATCWKVTCRDNMQLGFTDCDEDITVAGLVYSSKSGFTPTAVASSSGLNVDNLDINGVLSSSAISKDDIIAGLYDYAEIEVFQVDYNNPDAGKIVQRVGWLGEVVCIDGQFIAEVRGLTQQLNQNIASIYSRNCRAVFGDARCSVDVGARTYTGQVTSVESQRIFSDSSRLEDSDIFDFGVVEFTSGANSGLSVEVKQFRKGGKIELVLPLPKDISIGDNYKISEGCDKRMSTCIDRFNNVINFRAEPHVPGMDRIMETASTRRVQ